MKFNEWLDEMESFSSRWHRLLEEYELDMLTIGRTKEWLEAAYNKGFQDGYNSPTLNPDKE